MELRKDSENKSDLQGHAVIDICARQYATYDFLIVFHCEIAPFLRYYQRAQTPKFKEVT